MLSYDKVILRPMEETDLKILYRWMQDAELLKLINRTVPTNWVSHQEWYRNVSLNKDILLFSVVTCDKSELIGQCGLKNIDHRNQKAELYIFIGDKKYHSVGYGKDAIKCLLIYAFDLLNLNRIFLYLLDNNEIAYHFYEKIGFKLEGRFKQDIFSGGRFHDTIHMAILRQEFCRG